MPFNTLVIAKRGPSVPTFQKSWQKNESPFSCRRSQTKVRRGSVRPRWPSPHRLLESSTEALPRIARRVYHSPSSVRARKIGAPRRQSVRIEVRPFLTETTAWIDTKCPIAVIIPPACFERATRRPVTTIFRPRPQRPNGWIWWKSLGDGAGR